MSLDKHTDKVLNRMDLLLQKVDATIAAWDGVKQQHPLITPGLIWFGNKVLEEARASRNA